MRSGAWWIAVFALPLLAQDRPTGQGVNFYSLEKEAALGRQLAADATRNTKPLDSAAVRDYVNQLGAGLAAKFSGPAFTYTFAVISRGADNATHEPLSLPGGYIFVPASLFLAAQDEAEFAGMLAHSIAHIARRHYTRQATRGQLVNMSLGNMSTAPLIYMGGPAGQAMDQNQNLSIPLGLLRLHRENELEADRLAADSMAAAGFDPAALALYIGRVQPEDGSRSWVFSPLPTRDQRLGRLEDAVRALPAQAYAAGVAFQVVRDEVRRLLPTPALTRPPTLRR
ncbi:MAG TPA: M48 family metalloprotease [Candidatus Acidoferrales bacterium]|jgi:predicted Zn-dependent protease|nr:M48 family metalloprotease [Candidatus Acidoferrales bacterium]